MILTLYKKCILNDKYSEVFRNEETLSDYLDRLDKKVFRLGVEIYPTLNGSFYMEYWQSDTETIFDFNYLKLEPDIDETNLSKIYAFIDSIVIQNGVAIISFSTDVWSTYNTKWDFRGGLLVNTKFPNLYNIDQYAVPMEFETTQPPVLEEITGERTEFIDHRSIYYKDIMEENDDDYNCLWLVEIQYYKLTSGGNKNKNNIQYCIFDITKGTQPSDKINNLISFQADSNSFAFLSYPTGDNKKVFSYEIGNIYCIPYKFGLASLFKFPYMSEQGFYFNNQICAIDSEDSVTEVNVKLWLYPIMETYANYLLNSYILDKDFTKELIGFCTSNFPISKNGNNGICEILCNIDKTEFSLWLKCEGNIYNITDLFNVDLPFTSVTSDVTAQREISKKMKKLSGGLDIFKGASSIVQSGFSFASAGLKGRGYTKGKRNSNISNGIGELTDGVVNIANGIGKIWEANQPQFKTTTANSTIDNGFMNGFYGLCYFNKIPSNIVDVEELINEVGYDVYGFTKILYNNLDSWERTQFVNSNKNDCIKFAFVRLNGLTSEINDIIEDILLNGVKIWYTGDING